MAETSKLVQGEAAEKIVGYSVIFFAPERGNGTRGNLVATGELLLPTPYANVGVTFSLFENRDGATAVRFAPLKYAVRGEAEAVHARTVPTQDPVEGLVLGSSRRGGEQVGLLAGAIVTAWTRAGKNGKTDERYNRVLSL